MLIGERTNWIKLIHVAICLNFKQHNSLIVLKFTYQVAKQNIMHSLLQNVKQISCTHYSLMNELKIGYNLSVKIITDVKCIINIENNLICHGKSKHI